MSQPEKKEDGEGGRFIRPKKELKKN